MGCPPNPRSGDPPRSDSFSWEETAPTDERLVDYLLGQPTAVMSEQRAGVTDREIEAWLGRDQANLVRLEALAVSVVALLGQEPGVGRSLVPANRVPVTPAAATGAAWVREHRSVLTASWGVVALLLLTVGVCFGWRNQNPVRDRTDDFSGDLALAWAEQAAVDAPSVPFSSDPAEESWELAWPESETGSVSELADPLTEADAGPAFAEGGDSPPDWLVLAVAQLSRFPGADERDEDAER